ncbi:MAG: glycosyltransferase family 39 protein [Anaerolineae bacterium]|nr:glycosyltransferase family 39 protein [Anaerolineae bacterium]
MSERLGQFWARRRRLVLLVAAALLIRVLYTAIAPQIDPFLRTDPLHGDAGSYDQIARSLLAGNGFSLHEGPTAFWPPLYPYFLAGLYALFGYHLWIARLVQALLGAIAVGAVYETARLLFGRRVALLAGIGMLLYPHVIYFGAWLIAEALYMALFTVAVWLAIRLQQRPGWLGFGSLGLLMGLGLLAKPATLMFIPFLALWAWFSLPALSRCRRATCFLLVLLVLVAVVAPWTVRNGIVFQDFILVSTNGGYTFYGANNEDAFGGHREGFPPRLPGLSEPEAEQEYYRRALEWGAENPGDALRLSARKLARLFSPLSVASYERDYDLPLAGLVKGVYWAFLLAVLVGMLLTLPRWRELILLYALILRVLIGTVLFYGDARYTLPMVPAWVIFAAVALASIYRRGLNDG